MNNFRKYGYDSIQVGTRVPVSVVDKIEDEILDNEDTFEDELFKYEDIDPISDADFSAFSELEDELSEEDYASLYEQLEEDDR